MFKHRAVALAGIVTGGAEATEQGKSVYLLGYSASMAGETPPPGAYLSSLTYLYSGNGSGAAAVGRVLPLAEVGLPGVAALQTNANVSVTGNVALDAVSALWVAPEPVLGGGHFGVGALVPVGYQEVNGTVNALSRLTFPDGSALARDGSRDFSANSFTVGDPMAVALLGWSSGNWHWKAQSLINVPVGQYSNTSPVNISFNHWALDLSGAVTWLEPKTGVEVSLMTGFTFNAENPASEYKSGNGFHLEGAMMQHFSQAFAIGVAGYHYQQVTGDSGAGAVLGPYKGRVSAIGPNVFYNFQVGKTPVLISARWLREFGAVNRLQGDAGILTVTIPLGATATH